ncbi:MAG TPA: twin-arginine translocase TatA/TatE family subunit [Acidobacteriaceae bacterium]|jgi:sec-independent protein translocase protein TatB|nr:twin-arginine translocase TatA/TatE family subunit [Acidobacteriaceae bacterium]
MPSFGDSIFLFVLALLLFGPKKLPVLARELGKWVGEFRRASNEFKMQMEEELRQVEQADRQKQIAAMEAAAPIAPPLDPPEHPHLADAAPESLPAPESSAATDSATLLDSGAENIPQNTAETTPEICPPEPQDRHPEPVGVPGELARWGEQAKDPRILPGSPSPSTEPDGLTPDPLPIAVSGNLRIMPPATGLPTARTRPDPLGGLLDSIPESSPSSNGHATTSAVAAVAEGEAHGR